jgi:exodeoxyribonuclease-5
MQTESFALSVDQQAVADQVANYVQDLTHAGNELALGGYAGTGKSTVLGYLRSTGTLPTGTVYLAPTGKAAHVLRSKGLAASTIHSFLYLYQGLVEETDDDGDPTGKLKPVFADKDTHDDVELIVVDEASMVNDKLYDDLCALSCPILWVGDHGQLAPVGGDPGIMRDPRLRLEQVHRQAQGSDILAIAHDVRQTGNARKWIGHDTSDLFVGRPSGRRVNSHKVVDYACASEVDQIVVPFNNLRHEINATYRNRLGGV